MHGSARLTVHARALPCQRVEQEGWTIGEAAEAAGVSRQIGSKWIGRYRDEGAGGLRDRSTRPHHSPRRVSPGIEAKIAKARLATKDGPHMLTGRLVSPARRSTRCCAALG